jgi:hypothetical protein
MPGRERKAAFAAIALLVVLSPVALQPLYSYDYFWHLASGRWIAEHSSLPLTDPFAVASDRTPWINGEWLFQLPLYGTHAIGGIALVAWSRAILVAAIFAAGFFFASFEGGVSVALFLTSLSFAGGSTRLDARPGTAAAALLVAALVLLSRKSRPAAIAYVALTVVWINTHPSALLAPILAGAVALLGRGRRDAWVTVIASAAALFVNPFGARGVIAPLRLTAFVGSGTFVNAEWLPSPIRVFPLLYFTVVAGVVAFAVSQERREQLWRLAIFALLAWLALAHVRNQGLYFAAFPLLITPMVRRGLSHRALAAAAIIPIAWLAVRLDHSSGVARHRFPIASVARLKETHFAGNIYNPDQFGGFLIWSFYPQRRALTDGRNELYHEFILEYSQARLDSRAWHALLRKYQIDLAVDEYRGPIESVDALTGARRSMPASLAYFPRREWALIGYDDVSMVFARRAVYPQQELDRWEIRGVVPDAAAVR